MKRELVKELLERHYSDLRVIALAKVSNKEYALELLQESCSRAWRSADSFQGQDWPTFKAWMKTIFQHVMISNHRKLSNVQWVSMAEVPESALSVSLQGNHLSRVEQYIKLLSTPKQRTIRGYVVYGYKLGEISKLEGVPLETVRARYYNGIKDLRTLLSKKQTACS